MPPGKRKHRTHLGTLGSLLPFLWPRARHDLKFRVVLALSFIGAAKAANVYVPFLYKGAVDVLSGEAALIAVPVMLIVAYGVARVLAQAFGELRDAVFAKVGQHAIRSVALRTFNHLHRLSLRFHVERQTGGLSRVIERGTNGIDFLLTFMLFNILPTLL
ncbi:MAG: metal ABC transporter permease, partial [Alphaproteobacteria bacterium]|nr:metal ABC transporter permease [Alphaproteobacteria bacterium]